MRANYGHWIGTVVTTCALLSAQPDSRPTDYAATLEAWLGSEHEDAALLQQAVTELLAAGKPALRHLGAVAKSVLDAPGSADRHTGLELVLRDIALGFLERENSSGMFYAGQFEPLAELQPWVGRMFLQLVIDTPDWFPDNLRTSVVPAIRDLFPRSPGRAALSDLRAIAIDEVHQPAELRFALACAFAQWQDPTLVRPFIDEVTANAGEGKTADELHFVRRLAVLHYRIRDYAKASDTWTDYLRGSERIESRPPPLDYYNAACSLSMAGRIPEALREIEACGALLRSENLDESHEIERKLFDTDPELRAVRPTRRFQKLVDDTFGRRKV